MENKASVAWVSKTQDFSNPKLNSNLNCYQKDEITQEFTSDSKSQNLKKYIKKIPKPFQYKNKINKSSKIQVKYFNRYNPLKKKTMKIKNDDNSVNKEYEEVNLSRKVNVWNYRSTSEKRKYNQINDKTNIDMNYISQVTDGNRNSHLKKMKEYIKTQNQGIYVNY